MLAVLKNSWPLMMGMLLLMLGNGLQGTLLGVRGAIENIDPTWLGYVMSGYFIGFLGGSKITPMLIRRVGHVRVFAALGSTASAAFILYAAFVDPLTWFFLRVIAGFCFSGIYVVAESWLNDSVDNNNRGQALSLYLIVQMMGIIAGQLLLNLSDPAGYELFVLISVLVSLSFAPILLSTNPAPVYSTAKPMTLRELSQASPLACFGIFMLGGIFSALFGMAPVYATQLGFSVAEISYFVTAIYVGGLVFQYPIGWLSDRMDRRLLIIGLTAISGIVAASVVWSSHSLFYLIFAAFIIGGGSNPLYSLLIAYANDYMEPEQMSSASGGLVFLNGIGAMGGPILVGFCMANFGLDSFFIFLAIWMATICLYGCFRMTQRASIDKSETAPYMPLTNRVSQVATEIALESYEETSTDQ